MTQLKLSRDRKVAPYIQSPFGKTPKPIANSFGLPAGVSCPGMTDFCRSSTDGKWHCYAAKIEAQYGMGGGPAKLVRHNWEVLTAVGDDVPAMVALLSEAVDAYLDEHRKAVRRGAVIERMFRVHWDGDFWSAAYARAWAHVIRANPTVSFWAYTRTFGPDQPDVVGSLANLPNLRLYLSVDAYNKGAATAVLEQHSWVKVASCDSSYEAAQSTMVTLRSRRAPKCPENATIVPLINADGVGACASCKLCTPLGPDRDVLFSTSHK